MLSGSGTILHTNRPSCEAVSRTCYQVDEGLEVLVLADGPSATRRSISYVVTFPSLSTSNCQENRLISRVRHDKALNNGIHGELWYNHPAWFYDKRATERSERETVNSNLLMYVFMISCPSLTMWADLYHQAKPPISKF